MNEANPKHRELMEELRQRFQDSASTMRRIARRIQAAADASHDVDRRAAALRKPLSEHLGDTPAGVAFSYLEYLEFSGADEFARFRHAAPLTDQDLRGVDWDDLQRRLLETPPEK